MQVTIILEDLNLFSSQAEVSTKKAISRRLKLKITRPVFIYTLLCVIGLLLILFRLPITGVILLAASSVLFYVLQYFKNVFNIKINFTEADDLDRLLQEDLYDNN